MPDNRPTRRKRSVPPHEIEPDVAGVIDDDGSDLDESRHYLQDPNHLAGSARDEDELAADDLLDVDQTELEELGLVLDDPHQPGPE
jgi:hypothetical protein